MLHHLSVQKRSTPNVFLSWTTRSPHARPNGSSARPRAAHLQHGRLLSLAKALHANLEQTFGQHSLLWICCQISLHIFANDSAKCKNPLPNLGCETRTSRMEARKATSPVIGIYLVCLWSASHSRLPSYGSKSKFIGLFWTNLRRRSQSIWGHSARGRTWSEVLERLNHEKTNMY